MNVLQLILMLEREGEQENEKKLQLHFVSRPKIQNAKKDKTELRKCNEKKQRGNKRDNTALTNQQFFASLNRC